jgi:hypothetical protein
MAPIGRVLASVFGGGAAYVGVVWLALGDRLPWALRQMALVRFA